MRPSIWRAFALGSALVLGSCYRGPGTSGPSDLAADSAWPSGLSVSKWEPFASEFNGVYSETTKRGCCWIAQDASLRIPVGSRRPKSIFLDFYQNDYPERREPLLERILRLLSGHHKAVTPPVPQIVTVIFSKNGRYASPRLTGGFAELSVDVPPDAKIHDGILVVVLHMSKSFVPKNADPQSQDTRRLSLILRSVDVRDEVSTYLAPKRTKKPMDKVLPRPDLP